MGQEKYIPIKVLKVRWDRVLMISEGRAFIYK